jgi:hypothetical protein
MTNGVVLFAYNNQEIDYAQLAWFAAKKVTQFLEVPVTVITDDKTIFDKLDISVFDKIIELDQEEQANSKYFTTVQIRVLNFLGKIVHVTVCSILPHTRTHW